MSNIASCTAAAAQTAQSSTLRHIRCAYDVATRPRHERIAEAKLARRRRQGLQRFVYCLRVLGPRSTISRSCRARKPDRVLVQLAKGKAVRVIRAKPSGNGLEAWRLLVKAYEPVERGCALGPTSGAVGAVTFMDRLGMREKAVCQNESASGRVLPPSARAAVAMGELEDPLRAHDRMAMGAGDTGDYATLSSKIERYCLARRSWSFDATTINSIKNHDGKGKAHMPQ